MNDDNILNASNMQQLDSRIRLRYAIEETAMILLQAQLEYGDIKRVATTMEFMTNEQILNMYQFRQIDEDGDFVYTHRLDINATIIYISSVYLKDEYLG